jgi:hypothetical protein
MSLKLKPLHSLHFFSPSVKRKSDRLIFPLRLAINSNRGPVQKKESALSLFIHIFDNTKVTKQTRMTS